MSLEIIPAAPVKPNTSILPRALILALSLAVSACHEKPKTHPRDTHVDTPLTEKQQLIKKLITETLAVTKGGDNIAEFQTDERILNSWQLQRLDVTISRGTQAILMRPDDHSIREVIMHDKGNDGIIDSVQTRVIGPGEDERKEFTELKPDEIFEGQFIQSLEVGFERWKAEMGTR